MKVMFICFRFFILIFIFSLHQPLWAQSSDGLLTNQLAIGQGISSPNIGTSITTSNGYTTENPVVASYQSGYRASAFVDGTRSTSFGLEAGLGDGTFGMAIGYYSNACDGCDAYVRGLLSSIWGKFGIGLSLQDGLYNLGFILNPYGKNRWGLVVEYDGVGNSTNGTRVGFGYSYVIPKFTFSLDASKRSLEDPLLEDGPLMLSPGMAIRIDKFSVSATADFYIGDTYNGANEHVWFGIKYNLEDTWHLALYGEYQDQWALSATYIFE